MGLFKELLKGRKAILFDVDGTLVDSNDLHAEAWAKALNHFGKAVSTEVVRSWIGMGGDKILHDLAGVEDQGPEGKAIAEFRAKIFKEDYAPRIEAFPKAAELIREIRQQGFRTAFATSAQKDEIDSILKAAGLQNLVDWMTTSDDAQDSKPDPDIICGALQKGRLQANEALMVGDTPYDIEASEAAGVPIIAVRSGGWDDKALHRAALIVDGVEELYRLFQQGGDK